jgi:hypothetical protein
MNPAWPASAARGRDLRGRRDKLFAAFPTSLRLRSELALSLPKGQALRSGTAPRQGRGALSGRRTGFTDGHEGCDDECGGWTGAAGVASLTRWYTMGRMALGGWAGGRLYGSNKDCGLRIAG